MNQYLLSLSPNPHLAIAMTSFDWSTFASIGAWLAFLGRLHPVVVHFPIALLITGAGLEALSLANRALRRKQGPDTEPPHPGHTVRVCLALGAVSGLAACVSGWTLASVEPPPGSLAQTVSLHRWLAISATIVAGTAFAISMLPNDRTRRLFRPFLFLSGALVGVAGHFGGALVFGHGHLTAPFTSQSQEGIEGLAILPVSGPVATIFDANCRSCHGPSRQRGGLRLDDPSSIAASGTVVPGDPEGSELLRRVLLFRDHPDAMPPEGDDPLTRQQIETLRTWIGTVSLEDRTPPTEIEPEPSAIEFHIELTPDQLNAHHVAIGRLTGLGVVVAPIHEGTPAISVHFNLLGPEANNDTVMGMAGLELSVIVLDLSGTAVTDAVAETVVSMSNLEELSLARTGLGDETVGALSSLPRLRSLNLFATRVSDDSVANLARMEALEVVYVTESAMTQEGVAELRAAAPRLRVIHEHD